MNVLSEINSVSRWLDVFGSTEQKLDTIPKCVSFVDVSCDSDYKLVIGDLGTIANNPKMKVFKGTSMIHEIVLPDIPANMVAFYTNESVPRSPPAIAVALSSMIYIYKNMKLFYKFYLPQLEVSSLEVEIWKKISELSIQKDADLSRLINKLYEIPFANLTSQSQHLLSTPPERRAAFIKQNKDQPLQKYSVITCMTTLNMNSKESDGIACLVIGTENGDVMLLDSQTFTVSHRARVNNVKLIPCQMETIGLHDVEYKILIATREGSICLLKREWLEGKNIIQLTTTIVEFLITPGDNSIVVATTDKNLHCFNKKGKKMWSLDLPQSVTTIHLVQIAHLGMNLVAVAMNGGFIHFYNGKNLVDSLKSQDTVTAMKYGQLGQEENVLAIITVEGTLLLKILKRTADFNVSLTGNAQKNHPSYMAAQQARPLLVPKKSKLFLEQATREREQAIEMHHIFQRELCELRLHVAKATIESIQNASNSINIGSSQPLRLSAKVEGLGPVFKIHLTIENLAEKNPVINLSLLFAAENNTYKISPPYIPVPMLIPSEKYNFVSKATEIFNINEIFELNNQNEDGEDNEKPPIKVYLVQKGNVQPILTASIYIPPTDPLMIPFC